MRTFKDTIHKSNIEIKKLQKKYGIFHKIKPLHIASDINSTDLLIQNKYFFNKLKMSVDCKNGALKSKTNNGNKILFSCELSGPKEFRYTVFYAYIKNKRLNIEPIDSGGGNID